MTKTPRQTEGPFYPDKLPLDTDNDLIVINDEITPAIGEITHFSGSVKTAAGSPVRNAVVEIWQADIGGNYIHTQARDRGNFDGNFQGYGRFLTGSTGEYYFRCIKPTPYTRRTPHIHVAVSVKGHRVLTTQCYIKGNELNAGDRILNRTPEEVRDLLISDFQPIPGSETGELSARFDMIIGLTPED
ncbi:MAG: protocatechuate 3,4-dioxygenase [Verrucomicrobiales bacterium]|nr:protocatechuate 3,4-dioxygenase [Verrucomicrobiales bacterium]